MSFPMDRQATAALLHLEQMLLDETLEPKALPLSLLESITNGFADDHEIGRGGYAVVYKGKLQDGTVAVKKLSFNIHMDENEFQREVQCLMKVKHKNIVRFLGYCADTQGNMEKYDGKLVMADVQQRLLCFEYLPNGTVHDYIADASRRLQWRTCYKIIKGICDGLHHLHENHIVHLDLKPLNVLLDEHMVPKIADFGLSRCFAENQSHTITSKVIGSQGYFAPELYSGRITKKSDIYSLGVLILEMLTGEKGYPDVGNVLACWSGRLEKAYEDEQLEQVRVCTEIGIDCSDFNPAKRPFSAQNIIKRLKETETMDEESSAVPNALSGKLFVHPHVLCFFSEPYEVRLYDYGPHERLSWSSVYLTNYTDEHVAFRISEKLAYQFSTYVPLYGIVAPRLTHALALTMKNREKQFNTLVLESAIIGSASDPMFVKPLSQNDWNDVFEKAKMNAKTVQRIILEAFAAEQIDITSELKPPQKRVLHARWPLRSNNCLDVNSKKQWIMAGSTAGNIRIWSYRAQEKVESFKVSREKVVSVKFIVPKQWFVAGSEDGFIHVYSYEPNMRRNLSFKAHIKPLKSLDVHPTKPYLMSSSSHVMKLWDWDKDWEHILTFKSKYPGSICLLAFNPKNTNCFVTASDNHIVEVWSLDSPHSEYMLSGHSDKVNSFDFFTRDDQEYLITGSNDCTAKIWNMHKKSCTHTLHASNAVTSVSFYPNLLVLVIGLKNGAVQLWSSTHFRLETIFTIERHLGSLCGLACFVRSKGLLMVIGETLALVDMDSVSDREEPRLTADIGRDTITQMFPADGELLVVQPLELRIPFQLYKPNSFSLDLTNNTDERVAFKLRGKSRMSLLFANLPTGGIIPPRSTCTLVVTTGAHTKLPEETNCDMILLSTISGDRYIAQFEDIYECHEFFDDLEETAVHEVEVRAVFCPQGDITFERVYDRMMSSLWKFSKRPPILDAHPTGRWILTGDSEGYVQIRDLVTQERKDYFQVTEGSGIQSGYTFEIMAPCNPVKSRNSVVKFLKLIVRKQWFLVGTSDGLIHVCSYGTKIQQITSFRASKSSLTSIAIHPTEPYVLSSAEESPIKLWNWDNGWECTHTYEDEHSRTIHQVTFNPKDTDTFASASSDHTVKIWSLHSAKSKYTLFEHLGEVNCLDFFTRDDQQYLIFGSDDLSLRICDLQKRACVHKIEDLMSPVISLVSLPDRPYLLIGLQDGTVHLWSSANFEFERIFNFGYQGTVGSICLLGWGRVIIGREDNIFIIDTDNIKPATIKGNNGEERGNMVHAVKSYVVFEAQLEYLDIFKEPKDNLPLAQQAVLGTGTTSESAPQAIKEMSEEELTALTCLSLGRPQI